MDILGMEQSKNSGTNAMHLLALENHINPHFLRAFWDRLTKKSAAIHNIHIGYG